MKRSEAELISRSMDGRLSVAERAKAERLLAEDPQAAAAARIWQAIGDQLRMDAGRATAPDPVLAWQEIRREIRRNEPEPAASWFGAGIRWAAVLAMVAGFGLAAWSIQRHYLRSDAGVMADPDSASRVDWVKVEVPGATTMIYTDIETDMTVIWMDLAQNTDPRDS